jgi:hypothetical protein
MDPIYTPTAYLPKIHSDPILPSTPWSFKWSLSFWLSYQNPVHIPLLSHTCHMSRPPHSPWFDLPNNIWEGVQNMKFLIVQLPRKLITESKVSNTAYLLCFCVTKYSPCRIMWLCCLQATYSCDIIVFNIHASENMFNVWIEINTVYRAISTLTNSHATLLSYHESEMQTLPFNRNYWQRYARI